MSIISITGFLTFLSTSVFFFGYISNNSLFPEPLSLEEEKKYVEMFENGNIEAKNILIEKNLDKNGKFRGITRNYITVRLDDGEFNTLKRVQLDSNKINLNNKQL